MKLERLTLENFRQYYGRQTIEFAKGSTHSVTVIHGVNGAGKTGMFIALNWCLYGEGGENVGELMSKEAMRLSEPGHLINTRAELTFTHNGQRYAVRRGFGAVKQIDGTMVPYDGQEFVMRRILPNGESKSVDSPITTMNAILPANVRTYFLFDGEKIDDFAKPEAAGEVKDAIYLVLRLEVLDRARKHLQDLARDYRHELSRIAKDKQLLGLVEERERLDTQRETNEAQIGELEQEIKSARKHIDDIDRQLRDMQEVSQLQEQRVRTESELKQVFSELQQTNATICAYATASYAAVGQSIVDQALAVLDGKRNRGEIPSSIRQQLVHDLLDQLVCICGRRFEEHGPEYHRLENLLANSVPGSLEDAVLELNSRLRGFAVRNEERFTNIDREMKRRVVFRDRINSLEAQLGDLERQLKDSPLEDVGQLEKRRQEFRAQIDSYNLDIGSLREQNGQLTKRINEIDQAIPRAKKNSARAQLLSEKIELTQGAANAIDETYQVFADRMREQIEAKTKEIFKTLVWKESHFQDIRLGSDYYLEVIDRYGLPARPELSAGERQVLSLSFIAAMSRVSEEEAPIVMDTPFGRLSSQHRINITLRLPELADQLILFVTDEELPHQAQINLQPHVGAAYLLDFDDATGCTTIREA